MAWRDQKLVREQYVEWYDDEESELYDNEPGHGMSLIEESALLADLREAVDLTQPLKVLDVGAGTGVLTKVLAGQSNLSVSALEPSQAMLSRLQQKVPTAKAKCGFTDAAGDADHYEPDTFDLVISRQVVCGLFDPLQAFENWRKWLKPGGSVVVIDGLWDPWDGKWGQVAEKLPLSSVKTPALTPYLLEKSGFVVCYVGEPRRTNLCLRDQAAQTGAEATNMRYIVVAEKPAEPGAAPAPAM